jgi:hypothetical protein
MNILTFNALAAALPSDLSPATTNTVIRHNSLFLFLPFFPIKWSQAVGFFGDTNTPSFVRKATHTRISIRPSRMSVWHVDVL